jgi:superfamily II DNA helicase RecQ
LGVEREAALDAQALADERGVTVETVRRGLSRLHDLGRIDYVPPFRGRATDVGRGGLAEDALDGVDFEMLETKRRREEAKLDEMVAYASTPGCRARYLLDCFGVREGSRCGTCDRCSGRQATHAPTVAPSEHVREAILTVLQAVRAHDKRYGFGKLAGHLAGSHADALSTGPLSRGPTRGALSHLGVKGADRWLRVAYDAGLLRLVPHKLAGNRRTVHTVGLSPLGQRVLKGEPLPEIPAG